MLTAYSTFVLWLAYPVVWALCEGTGAISGETEPIIYFVLDICAKAGVSFVLIHNHAIIEDATAGFQEMK